MPPHRKQSYRPDIDGLRAIAVLSVVFYHAGLPGFPGGYVGVDVFFVISGFLITGIVWSELQQGTFSLGGFYVRRIKRIFPALFAVLALASVAASVLLLPIDLKDFGKAADATVLFYSNFHWAGQANYFDGPSIEKPLLHMWSLSVEEQFYAVWPLLLLLLSRIAPARASMAILGIALVSLLLSELRLPDYQKDAFYLPWCRAWELGLGALLAVAGTQFAGRAATALAGAGLAAIALSISLYDPSTRFPGIAALLPCGGAALLIAAGNFSNPVSRALSIGPVRHVGLISYSLYLIHWPLFSFAHILYGLELPLDLRLSLLLASFLLAEASWRFIEKPARTAQLPRLKVFGTAAAATGLLYAAGLAFFWSGGLPSRVSAQVLQMQKTETDWGLPRYCRNVQIPTIKGDMACELGEDHGGAYDFVVWGDSHAKHFAPAIATMAKERKLSGLLLSKSACWPFLNDPHASKGCTDFNSAVAQWIEAHPVKLAILAGRWFAHKNYLKKYAAQDDPAQNPGGLAKTLAFLTGKGVATAVMDQVPNFPFEIKSCIARSIYYRRDYTACVTQPAAKYQSGHRILTDYFSFLQRRYSFTIASAAGLICNPERCNAMDGETLLMGDSNHLTEEGSLRAIPYLKLPLLSGSANASVADPAAPAVASKASPQL